MSTKKNWFRRDDEEGDDDDDDYEDELEQGKPLAHGADNEEDEDEISYDEDEEPEQEIDKTNKVPITSIPSVSSNTIQATTGQPFRSRFWRNEGEESDEEVTKTLEELEAEEEEAEEIKKARQTKRDTDMDSSKKGEGEKKILLTAEERLLNDFSEHYLVIMKAISENDWISINNEFGSLLKTLEKFDKRPGEKYYQGTPKKFIKLLMLLDDACVKISTAEDHRLSASQGKAFGNFKSKIMKNVKKYQKEVEQCKKDLHEFSSQIELEDNKLKERIKKREEKAAGKPSGSESETDQKSLDGVAKGTGKKTKVPVMAAAEKKEIVYNDSYIEEKLQELIKRRGSNKSGTVQEQHDALKLLLSNAKSLQTQLLVLSQMISTDFDLNPNQLPYCPIDVWKDILENVQKLLKILNDNNLNVFETQETTALTLDIIKEEEENSTSTIISDASTAMNGSNPVGNVVKLYGNLFAFVERLSDEFTKSLRNIDYHNMNKEYSSRLEDEVPLISLAESVYLYYTKMGIVDKATIMASKLFDHLYVRNKLEEEKLYKVWKSQQFPSIESALKSLSALLYAHGDDRQKTRTVLMHIYWLALTDQYYDARDLLLMSKLQESIHRSDVPTQILYNRAITQLGLCAFRLGLISQARHCLGEIASNPKVKELLAQGLGYNRQHQDKKQEKELKEEKARLFPSHLHINIDMLDAVCLFCSMLTDVPHLMRKSFSESKKTMTKAFRRLMELYEKQVFVGPPETLKDHLHAGIKALMKSDWKGCYDVLSKLTIWNYLVPSGDAALILEMMKKKIKVAALKVYLFNCSKNYSNVALEFLGKLFEMDVNAVTSVVSKMILKESFYVLLDDGFISIMEKAEPTQLQVEALRMVEKIGQFGELNSNLVESGPLKEKLEARRQEKIAWKQTHKKPQFEDKEKPVQQEHREKIV